MAYLGFVADENDPVFIEPSRQRSGGDVQKGLDYLINGDYVKSGIPYNIFALRFGKDKKNYLQRNGNNANISYEYTAVNAPNGELVVTPNCLTCHAQVLEDKLYVGLGNTFIDFTNSKPVVSAAGTMYNLLSIGGGKQFDAAKNFLIATRTLAPKLKSEVQGVNVADRLAAILAAHRDPETFKWSNEPLLTIPDEIVPTDVPAWWLLKKKNAMFYNGFGRGDFARFLMASNLLSVEDTAESREVDSHFPDVLAYLNSIKAPAYPKTIDEDLAAMGEPIFNQNCSHCHGTYGADGKYPNLLIPEGVIGTDSALFKSNYLSPQFVDWFNKSWFTTGDHPAKLVPFNGYIAPPLDGIWITAPYLHNGSVPTIEAVLNSKLRPTYWSRNFEKPEYDYASPGWKYEELREPKKNAYNTTLPGYGNYGHYFGDKLSDKQRKAVIEYLKTL